MTLELIIVFLLFTIVAWLRWNIAAALIVALLPLYQVRFQIAGVPITALEVLVLIVVIVWAAKRRMAALRAVWDIPWKWAMLLLLLAAAVAVYVAPDHKSALGYFKAFFLEPMLFFVALRDGMKGRRDVLMIVFALGCAVIGVGIVAVLQYFGLLSSPEPWVLETPRRVTSVFDFPNAIGLFAAPVIGLFLGIVSYGRKVSRNWNVFAWTVIGLGIVGILAAYSRGALGAVMLGALCAALLVHRRRRAIGIVALALALVVLIIPAGRNQLRDVITGADVSTDVRLVMWQGTASLLADHAIEGAGLGGFPAAYNQYRLIKHTELLQYPHNIILNFWVEIGLAGMLVMLWLFMRGLSRAAKGWITSNMAMQRAVLLGVVVSLIIMIIHGVVDVPYLKNDLAILFWVIMALIPLSASMDTGQEGSFRV